MSKQRPARRQHLIPQFYLKGFAALGHTDKIWVYRFRHTGAEASTSSPVPTLEKLENICFERDRFALTTLSGRADFDSVEKALARHEGQANPVIRKLRHREAISLAEKGVLAAYMSQLHRRSRRTGSRRGDLARQAARGMNWHSIAQNAADAGEFSRALDVIRNQGRYEDEAAGRIRALGTVLPLENVNAHLCAMRWRILCAPEQDFFLTSDTPILLGEGLGLKHPQASVVLPLSSSVALLVSWSSGQDLAFEQATSDFVHVINIFLIRQAHFEVYARADAQWIPDALCMLAEERTRSAGVNTSSSQP